MQRRPGGDGAGAAVDLSAAQQGGATAGGSAAASIGSDGGELGERRRGRRSFGRDGGGHRGGGAAKRRRPQGLLSSLFPSMETLAQDFLVLSHVSMGRSSQTIFLFFISSITSTRFSLLSSLYRREKERGCPKGNPVILRGFGPKIG